MRSVIEFWKQLQQGSEDQLQQEVEETATTDFLGMKAKERKNGDKDDLHGEILG